MVMQRLSACTGVAKYDGKACDLEALVHEQTFQFPVLSCLFLELVQVPGVGATPKFYDPHSAGSAICSGCDMMVVLASMPTSCPAELALVCFPWCDVCDHVVRSQLPPLTWAFRSVDVS